METILLEVLKFIGVSAAGGLTWDIMKETGGRLLAHFKKHFVNAGHFKDEQQAEAFFQKISTTESLNRRHPLDDVWSVYDNCTEEEASDLFKTEFIDWVKEHAEDWTRLGEKTGPGKGIFIQKQIVKGNAQVTNIGNQYNYRGTNDKNEHSDQ